MRQLRRNGENPKGNDEIRKSTFFKTNGNKKNRRILCGFFLSIKDSINLNSFLKCNMTYLLFLQGKFLLLLMNNKIFSSSFSFCHHHSKQHLLRLLLQLQMISLNQYTWLMLELKISFSYAIILIKITN